MVDEDFGETEPEDALKDVPRAAKEGKRKARQRRDKEVADLKMLLDIYEFRAFLWRLMSEGKIFQHNAYYGEEGQRSEGRRHIGLWALNEIFTSSPEQFIIMQKEDRERSEGKRQ